MPRRNTAAAILLGTREVPQFVPDDGAVAIHADDRRDIRRRAEQAGVSRYATHRVGVLVVDLAAHALSPPVRV